MSDLIDRQKLKDYVSSLSTSPLNEWDTWGVLAAIDKQPAVDAAPRWVRCEDRLPKDKEQVLCANPSVIIKGDYFYETCIYRDKTVSRSGFYRYDSEFGFVMEHPVYWMPIEPPKEDV